MYIMFIILSVKSNPPPLLWPLGAVLNIYLFCFIAPETNSKLSDIVCCRLMMPGTSSPFGAHAWACSYSPYWWPVKIC